MVILIIEKNVSFGILGHKKATNGYGKWQISICVLMNQDKCKWYQLRRSNWRTVVFYFIRQANEYETKCMKHVGLLSNYQISICAFSAQYLKTFSLWKDLENKWMRLSRWQMIEENYDLLNAVVFKRKFVRQIWVFLLEYELPINCFFASEEKWGISRTWSQFDHNSSYP